MSKKQIAGMEPVRQMKTLPFAAASSASVFSRSATPKPALTNSTFVRSLSVWVICWYFRFRSLNNRSVIAWNGQW